MTMSETVPAVSVAEKLAEGIAAVDPAGLPAAMRAKCEDLAVDVIGLCLTVRDADYVKATLAACDDDGPCTVIGHARTLSAAGAALVNGTAIHGEDFDDTFEGGPVHAGAVIVPAVLAACERHRPDGAAALTGIAVGVETMCRLGRSRPSWCTRPASTRPRCSAPSRRRPASPRRSGSVAAANRRCARHRRQHGLGHHRISRRGRLDQAHACGLGGAIGLARGAAGAARLRRAAHRVRGHPRPVPRLRPHHQGRLRRIAARLRHALGDADARLQALSLRDDGPPLHRLCPASRGARRRGRRHPRNRMRSRRGHGAPAVGAARRQAAPVQRLWREILDALLHRRRVRAQQCRAR